MKSPSLTFLLTIAFLWLASSLTAQLAMHDSIPHQNRQREYRIYVPAGNGPQDTLPLVLTLHGGGGNAASVQNFTQMNLVANRHNFVAVYPEGDAELSSGGYSWADGRGTAADLAGVDDVGFMQALLDTLMQNYAIDTNRIYICGFSNGGFMTQRLICEFSSRFAAAGALGCSLDTGLYAQCRPDVATPMLYVSGTADPEIPYGGGPLRNPLVNPIVAVDSAVQFWVEANHCQNALPKVKLKDSVASDSSTVELFRYTNCDCQARVHFYKVIGGGHTWPGVDIPALEPLLGETNEDFHAGFELWKFFRQYSKCSNSMGSQSAGVEDFAIYPNPVQQRLQLKAFSDKKRSYRIYDVQGRLLDAGECGSAIPVAHLQPGWYWLVIRGKTGVYRQGFLRE